MVDAEASPIGLGLTIALIVIVAFLLFAIVGGISMTGALEFVKWRLFMRYKKYRGDSLLHLILDLRELPLLL